MEGANTDRRRRPQFEPRQRRLTTLGCTIVGAAGRRSIAREEPETAAGFQAPHVIVDDLRERARSYRRFHALRSDRRTQSQDNAPSFFGGPVLRAVRYVCLFGRLSLTTLE